MSLKCNPNESQCILRQVIFQNIFAPFERYTHSILIRNHELKFLPLKMQTLIFVRMRQHTTHLLNFLQFSQKNIHAFLCVIIPFFNWLSKTFSAFFISSYIFSLYNLYVKYPHLYFFLANKLSINMRHLRSKPLVVRMWKKIRLHFLA